MISKMVGIASLILASVLVLGSATWAQPARPAGACSNGTLNGHSGFVVTGTDASGPTAASGQITADGKGGFAGMETVSSDGTITADVPVTGTYTIHANCTGKGTITPKGGPTAHFSFAVVSGGTELELVVTDSDATESGSAQAEGSATCTTKGVQGTYGLQGGGTLVGLGPIAFSGQVKLQQGVISGTESGSVNGQIFNGAKVGGAAKIGTNCFGKAVVSVNHQSPLHLDLVVVNGGNEIVFIETDIGTVVSGSLQR
ncbi:MAG TPA: hypothetical protein VN948_15165 [Terriglobales bacterium]|nr:hypothetical protein [Terriglobales bacterium]